MSLISRRRTIAFNQSKRVTDYRRFKESLRRDFHHTCAYCGVWERQAGGKNNFSVDHFVPRSIEPARERDPENLLYACLDCNRRKRDTYPYDKDGRGWEILDPCNVDLYEHYKERENGELVGLSNSAKYMIGKFRLNETSILWQRCGRNRVREGVAIVHQGRKDLALIDAEKVPDEEVERITEYLSLASDLIKQLLPRRMD